MPFTYTFYSFKGGVGRTLALVNVAAELAKNNKTVAIIDFDLEAPGLQTFSPFVRKRGHSKYGLLDFIKHYLDSFQSEKASPVIPEINDYIYQANKKDFTSFADNTTFNEKYGFSPMNDDNMLFEYFNGVWLMPSKGKNSKTSLADINWTDLYENKFGFELLEDLKDQIFQFTQADYLLIDSRTGFSDHAFICTNQLADALAIVFRPNDQNLAGLAEIIGKVREIGNVNESNILFVPSQIPVGDDEDGILDQNFKKFYKDVIFSNLKTDFPKGLKGFFDRAIDYLIKFYDDSPQKKVINIHQNNDFQLLNQEIFSLSRTAKTQLYRDYRDLTEELIKLDPNSVIGARIYFEKLSLAKYFISRIKYKQGYLDLDTDSDKDSYAPPLYIHEKPNDDFELFEQKSFSVLRFMNDCHINRILARLYDTHKLGFDPDAKSWIHSLTALHIFITNNLKEAYFEKIDRHILELTEDVDIFLDHFVSRGVPFRKFYHLTLGEAIEEIYTYETSTVYEPEAVTDDVRNVSKIEILDILMGDVIEAVISWAGFVQDRVYSWGLIEGSISKKYILRLAAIIFFRRAYNYPFDSMGWPEFEENELAFIKYSTTAHGTGQTIYSELKSYFFSLSSLFFDDSLNRNKKDGMFHTVEIHENNYSKIRFLICLEIAADDLRLPKEFSKHKPIINDINAKKFFPAFNGNSQLEEINAIGEDIENKYFSSFLQSIFYLFKENLTLEEKLEKENLTKELRTLTCNMPSRLLGSVIIDKLLSVPEVEWDTEIQYLEHVIDETQINSQDINNMTDRWDAPENIDKIFSYLSLKLESKKIICEQMRTVCSSDTEELKEELRKFYF